MMQIVNVDDDNDDMQEPINNSERNINNVAQKRPAANFNSVVLPSQLCNGGPYPPHRIPADCQSRSRAERFALKKGEV